MKAPLGNLEAELGNASLEPEWGALRCWNASLALLIQILGGLTLACSFQVKS